MDDSGWGSSLKSLLGSLDESSVKACSISGVPEQFRKLEKEAEVYKPKVVSIGPLYRGTNTELQHMEEIKYRSMLSLFHRSKDPVKSLDNCIKVMLNLDMVVRAFYVDDIKFNKDDLAKIMLLDGCFLLELLLSNAEQKGNTVIEHNSSFKFSTADVKKMGEIISDLILLGNQIPLLVLVLLFQELTGEYDSDPRAENIINGLVLFFFDFTPFPTPTAPTPTASPKRAHILDIVHSFITRKEDKIVSESNHHSMIIEASEKKSLEKRNYKTKPELNCCAYRLLSKGIEITRENEQQELQISDETGSVRLFGCYRSYRKGSLEIGTLKITEENEIQWRNFIAWESNRITHERYIGGDERTSLKFSEFALSYKALVCCEHDIKLLRKKQILVTDGKWSNEDLTKFFRTIARGIEIDATLAHKYGKMTEIFNQGSRGRGMLKLFFWLWHKFRRILINTRYSLREMFAILKRDHTPTVWKTIGVIAAVVLLFLTIAQTVFAAMGL